jgi:TetR/AcrR family transcriptional regulator, cholesterol catabolism regulator
MNTRDKIIEHAAKMFRTYGIRAGTMDMLASELGISKRTIYEIFRDKDDLLTGVLKWMSARQAELISRSLESSGNVIEAIFSIMDSMLDHLSKMSPVFKLDMKKYHNTVLKLKEENESVNNSREILARGIREGVFRSDLDLEITNQCLTGVTRMSDTKGVFPEEWPDEIIIRDFFVNYLRGISTQKGIELITRYEKKGYK